MSAKKAGTADGGGGHKGWSLAWKIVAGAGVVVGLYLFFIPADWLKPQNLWMRPRPTIASADAVRRWPTIGPQGLTQDTILVSIAGEQIPRSVHERDWHLLIYWRFPDAADTTWRLGRETTSRRTPTSLSMDILSSGPWHIDLSAMCASTYRGLIEIKPALVPPAMYDELSVNKHGSAAKAVNELPKGVRAGNSCLVETNGVTAGEPPSPYRQVGQLSANVTIERFRSLLGSETSRTHMTGGTRYSFLDQDYFVEAVADQDNRVVMFSVTTLSEAFTPTLRYWSGTRWQDVTLGVTTFWDCMHHPGSAYAFFYANRYLYFESHYLAHPGNYQTVLLADNYLGRSRASGDQQVPRGIVTSFGPVRGVSASEMRSFRQSEVVNTLGFFAPNSAFDKLLRRPDTPQLWIGPTAWDVGSMTGSSVLSAD